MQRHDKVLSPDFADLLRRFCQREHISLKQLAENSGLPFYTVRNWVRGHARPRNWQDVVKVAQVLRLSKAEANQLLALVNQPPLTQLLHHYPTQIDWRYWNTASLPPSSNGISNGTGSNVSHSNGSNGSTQRLPAAEFVLVEPTPLPAKPQPLRARLRAALRLRLPRHWPTILLVLLTALLSISLTYAAVPKANPLYDQFPPPQWNTNVWKLLNNELEVTPIYTDTLGRNYLHVGEKANFTFRIVNTWDKPAALPALELGMNGPDGCKTWQGGRVLTHRVINVVAMPGEGYTYKVDLVLPAPGIYFIQPINSSIDLKRWGWFGKTLWLYVVDSSGSLPDMQCMANGTPTP